MRVLVVSTSLEGGAGGSAERLLHSLRELGVDAEALVGREPAGGEGVSLFREPRLGRTVRRRLERILLARHGPEAPFAAQWLANGVQRAIHARSPDVVNLHWVLGGFVPIPSLARIDRPLVWTLHDMWAFTGGCHYAMDCARYQERCGACPQLGSADEHDLSRRVWSRKQGAWQETELTIVTPSTWLADCARGSGLFRERRIEVIPYGIDLETFRPAPAPEARAALGLDPERRVVLFGAWERSPRKGLDLLTKAVELLGAEGWGERAELVCFGPPWTEREIGGVPVRSLGVVSDPARLAQAFAAADVYVLPTRADNLPNTVLEAMACGRPCVSFRTGGLPDQVEHERTGWLAEPEDPRGLAEGIAWVLSDPERAADLGARARERAERDYDREVMARRYRELFEDVRRGARP